MGMRVERATMGSRADAGGRHIRARVAAAAALAALLVPGVMPSAAGSRTRAFSEVSEGGVGPQLFSEQAELIGEGVLGGLAEQGDSVALSANGTTAIVGGPLDNSGEGAAWVFVRKGSTWQEQAKLVGEAKAPHAAQGRSVALSADGNTAIVGGPNEEAGGAAPGAAWVWVRSGGEWKEQEKLVSAKASSGAQFGGSMALSSDGNTALIGGHADEGTNGAAWVYTRSAGKWKEQEKLVSAKASTKAQQGDSVALSEDGATALVGGPGSGGGEVGAAWLWLRSKESWSEGAELVGKGAGANAAVGSSVALDGKGDTALVGAPGQGIDGLAWVFTGSGASWSEQAKLQGEGATEAGEGGSVSLSEDGATALVGGDHDNVDFGAAWAFTRTGSEWMQRGEKLVGTGPKSPAEEGSGVALSADASTALIGGPGADAAWVFAVPGGAEPSPFLTVSLAGGGAGSVSGAGISCPGTCSAPYAPGTVVTLTATPASGSTFAGWSGECAGTGECTVTMDGFRSVVASFNASATGASTATQSGGTAGNGGGTAGSPAPRCTLKARSSRVLLPAHTRAKTKAAPAAGAIELSAQCDQAVNATLAGRLVELIGGKPKHGHQRARTFTLGPAHASLKAGVASTVAVKLPRGALHALAADESESATLTLVGVDADGTATARAALAHLKPRH